MKKHLYIFFILLTVLLKGQITFNGYYTTSYTDLASTHIFNEPDSSITFFSYSKSVAGGLQELSVSRIDKWGNSIINKNFNIRNQDFGAFLTGLKQFIPATPTSYFATGSNNGTNSSNLLFCKINRQTLDTMFTRLFNDNVNFYYLNNFIKFSDNKYYLIGNRANNLTQFQVPVIFHLDSNLNIVSSYTVVNSNNISTTNAILHPITKKLLLAGTITLGVNQTNVGFIEADTFGVVTKTMVIPYADIQGISQLKYSAFDDSYVFGGNIRTSKNGYSFFKINLTKLYTNSLNINWTKTYAQTSQLNNLGALLINPDGSIISCGRYMDSTLSQSQWDAAGVLLKVGINGDSLWMRRYNNYQNPPNPSNYFEAFYGVERAKDGGYIACGGIMNQPKSKAWVIKTDSMGCVAVGCGGLINGTYTATTDITEYAAKEGEFTLYPNPAHDQLMIERLSTTSSDAVGIQVLTLLGQVVMETPFIHLPEQLDVSTLPNGIYLLKLRMPNQREHIIKFVKE